MSNMTTAIIKASAALVNWTGFNNNPELLRLITVTQQSKTRKSQRKSMKVFAFGCFALCSVALLGSPVLVSFVAVADEPAVINPVTSETISPTGRTIPSLWWVQQQFAATQTFGDKLIEGWQATLQQTEMPGRVDYRVNGQLWSLLDYLARYSFLHEFGTAAKIFGYNIRVLDYRDRVLGEYICNFKGVDLTALSETSANPKLKQVSRQRVAQIPCEVVLESGGKAGFRGRPTNPLGGGAKGLDTE